MYTHWIQDKLKKNGENIDSSSCIQNVYEMDTQCSVGKCSVDNTTLHNITNYYKYIIGKSKNFENSTDIEKNAVLIELKSLEIDITEAIDNNLTEEKRTDFILMYWAVKEIFFSSHKVYLKYLTRELLFDKFLKTCSYKNKNDTKDFLDYFIKTLKNEIQRMAESKVI